MIKFLLTEVVSQCRKILPLAFSALSSFRLVSLQQDAGNISRHLPPIQLITVYSAGDILVRNSQCLFDFSLIKQEQSGSEQRQ